MLHIPDTPVKGWREFLLHPETVVIFDWRHAWVEVVNLKAADLWKLLSKHFQVRVAPSSAQQRHGWLPCTGTWEAGAPCGPPMSIMASHTLSRPSGV